jgi:hypothetical protein
VYVSVTFSYLTNINECIDLIVVCLTSSEHISCTSSTRTIVKIHNLRLRLKHVFVFYCNYTEHLPFVSRYLINIILIDICKYTISGQGYKQIVLPTKNYISCNLLLTWCWSQLNCERTQIYTGTTREVVTAYPSGTHEFTTDFQCGSCYSIFRFLCNVV